MRVNEAIRDYLLASEKHSKRTQGWYEQKLRVFGEWCEQEVLPLENIRVADIRRFIQHIHTTTNTQTQQPLSTYTVRGYAQVVKGFLNFCGKEDGLEEYVKPGLPKKIEMPHVDIKVIETFTPTQIKALFAASEKEFNQTLTIRDKAIISVLLDTGIRASELIGLKLDQVHLDTKDAYIKVYGKGRKEREVGLGMD